VAQLATAGLSDLTEESGHLHHVLSLAGAASVNESKLGVLRRLLRRSVEPAIVFTEYRDTLARIASELPDVQAVQLHGGLTSAERRDALREFTHGPARLLLATDAASEGLNLHHRCRMIVNLELPWTPLRLEQRVGRVDRIGQRARVHALHLVAGGTAEEHTVSRLLERMAHVRSALSGALSSGTDEDEVARAVMGLPSADPDAPRSNPLDERGAVVVPDLKAAALEEAHRVTTARSLQRYAAREPETRPVVTVLRRGRRRSHDHSYWAFRVLFTDSENEVLWSSLLGVEAVTPTVRAAEATRALVRTACAAIDQTVQDQHRGLFSAVRAMLEQCSELGRCRERDIAEELRRTRARLAGLQRGLFDHRADRAVAAQSAILDEALERCASRLRDLERVAHLSVGSQELVFASTPG
jgi:superfamily II DNA/RNA helicase